MGWVLGLSSLGSSGLGGVASSIALLGWVGLGLI